MMQYWKHHDVDPNREWQICVGWSIKRFEAAKSMSYYLVIKAILKSLVSKNSHGLVATSSRCDGPCSTKYCWQEALMCALIILSVSSYFCT